MLVTQARSRIHVAMFPLSDCARAQDPEFRSDTGLAEGEGVETLLLLLFLQVVEYQGTVISKYRSGLRIVFFSMGGGKLILPRHSLAIPSIIVSHAPCL